MTKKKSKGRDMKKSAIGLRKLCENSAKLRAEMLEEKREVILDYDSNGKRIRVEVGCYNIDGEAPREVARYGVKIFVNGEEGENYYGEEIYNDVLKYKNGLKYLAEDSAGFDKVKTELDRLLLGVGGVGGLSEKVDGELELGY